MLSLTTIVILIIKRSGIVPSCYSPNYRSITQVDIPLKLCVSFLLKTLGVLYLK